ncbi:hypothetical protein DKZ29_08125 [Limosilactobacillus reuteri]|uniref:hypothetical protein n=1 Tax=Limosilactobacillus reuteri TaxID=1598 RepID=UPI000D6FD117|nr:hypothetical protein [Limosilactobacillus reuteri]PWT35120.1 hypothetical protein DKZ24_05290 [Limosilactobacillus reuteri]PWT57619.1 hypothetical protein DKZ29_08125 [Limosilactobacillus reuteri]PWT59936.1 hypothetical protein DKZ30_04635 [Limosilactobacillus reuteri]
MELQEFINKGYSINAQVPAVQTQEILLNDLLSGEKLDDCKGDVIDTWFNDGPTTYDIIDPDGDLISPYDSVSALTSEEAVKEFIKNL